MDQTEKLSVTVTVDQARMIRERVESGAFASASEVIRAGLRSLEAESEERRERLEGLKRSINAALDDPRRLTTEEVHESLLNHHAEYMKRHGKA